MDVDIGARRVALSASGSLLQGGNILTVTFADIWGLGEPRIQLILKFVGATSEQSVVATIVSPQVACLKVPAWAKPEEVTVQVLIATTCEERDDVGSSTDTGTSAGDQHAETIVAVVPFSYFSDPAFDAAHYLLSNVDDEVCLSNIQSLGHLGFASGDSYSADLLLTRAFAQLPLPEGWSVLGTRHNDVREPRETLLHVAARLGLSGFVQHLITNTPGGREAAHVANKGGLLPSDVARSMSLAEVAQLIDRCCDQAASLTNGELPKTDCIENCLDVASSTSVAYPDIAQEVRSMCDRLQSASVQSTGDMYSHTPMPMQPGESAELDAAGRLHTISRTIHPIGDKPTPVPEPLSRSISEVQASIRSLEGYRHKISEVRVLRKDQLSRYSTSCPSLDCSWAEGAAHGRYRSMLAVPKEEEEDIAASADSPKLRSESVRGHDRPRSLDSLGTALRNSTAIASVINLTGVTQDSTAVGSEGELGNDGDSCSSAATAERLRQVSRNMFGGAKQQKSQFHLGMLTVESRSFSLGSLGSEEESESHGQSSNAAIIADDVQNIPSQDVPLLRRSGETAAPIVQTRPQSYGGPATKLATSRNPISVSAQPDSQDLGNNQAVRLRGPFALQPTSTNLNKSKSVSTPSIRSELSGDHARLFAEANFVNCDAVVEEDSDAQSRHRLSDRRSSLFTYATTLPEDDVRKKQSNGRRLSVFSKLGSQRKSKDVRRLLHTFIPVSSSAATCGVCRRALGSGDSSKVVYQCSCCLINTHDECRERAEPCTKTKVTRKTGSLVTPLLRHVRSAHSFRVASTQLPLPATSMSYGSLQQLSENSRPISAVNIAAAMMTVKTTSLDTPESVMTTVQEVISASVDSLTDTGNEEFEEDPELVHVGPNPEPEAWSDTVDKKLLKKLNAKYIQRQDNIFEFIATEKQYVRTLKMIIKVFVNGMIKQCGYTDKEPEKFFPGIANLLDIHATFLGRLLKRQDEKSDRSIDVVGDIILEQFDDLMGERMKEAYGRFVSRQREAVEHYKNKLKADRSFQEFVKRCSANPNTRRRGIQDLITIVTQRMTKYKTLLEQIIKNTKDAKDKVDRENLMKALECNKRILEHIDEAIETRSKELRLIEIYTRMDVRAVSSYDKTKTFRKSDFLAKGRKLRHEGVVAWRNAREKEVETLIVLLSDVVVFLQDNPQKYTFFSQDNKASVIPLSKLLVREKGSTKDNRGIYLIRQSRDDPEMIELVCRSAAERREWIEELRKAVHDCPEEDESASNEAAEEGREALEKLAKVNELVESLKAKDEELENLCKQRCQLLSDLLAAYGHADICDQIQSGYNEDGEFLQAIDLIKFALTEVSRLSSTYAALPPLSPTGGILGRSWSSVGEHQTSGNHMPVIPKRSDTFAGFEQGGKVLTGSVGRQRSATSQASLYGSSSVSSQELSPHDGDSGFREPYGIDVRDSGGSVKKLLQGTGAGQQSQPADRSSASLMQLIGAAGGNTGSSQQLDLAGAASGHAESVVALSNIASITALIPPSREQLMCLGQLSEYLQALLLITNKQDTTIESYKQQLADALLRMNKLNLEVEKVSTEKRNAFRHNKQMEEIRNLHELVSKERQQMEADKEKWRHRQSDEQRRLDELRAECDRQQEELRREREELQRQRDMLLKQNDCHATVPGRPAAGAAHPSAAAAAAAAARSSGRPTESGGRSAASSNGNDISGAARLRCDIPSEAGGASIVHIRSRSADVSVLSAAAGGHHTTAALPAHGELLLESPIVDGMSQPGLAGGARDRLGLAGTSSLLQSGVSGSNLRPRSAQSSSPSASTALYLQQYHQQSGNQLANLPPQRTVPGASTLLPDGAHPAASGPDGSHMKTLPGASLPVTKQDTQEIIYF